VLCGNAASRGVAYKLRSAANHPVASRDENEAMTLCRAHAAKPSVGVAVIAALLSILSAPAARPARAQLATAADYRQERVVIGDITAPQLTGALAAVRQARAHAGLVSTLPADELDRHLAMLLRWVVEDYARSGPLRLLSDLPSGQTAAGLSNRRLQVLRQTFWLQDNGLYGAAALLEYAPVLGRILTDRWHAKWQQVFPNLCRDTQSVYVIGEVPEYDAGGVAADPKCRLPRPGTWQFFRMHQYPDPDSAGFDSLPQPIFGTDHPVDPQGRVEMAPIMRNAPRNLLKYGCLRQVMLGNRAAARQMFDLALAHWNGSGFVFPKNEPGARLAGVYWTRDLAFALICANALGGGGEQAWGVDAKVSETAVEKRLWSAQSRDGGMFTNTCGDPPNPNPWCAGGGKVPVNAKETNEISPLVLLAYGPDIWQPRR
jgi:hypothetical protein